MNIDISLLVSFIDTKLIEYYDNYFFNSYGKIDDYISRLPLKDYISDIKTYRLKYKRARAKTRNNWYRNAIRDLNEIRENSLVIKHYNALKNENRPADTKNQDLTWDTYKDNMLKELNAWKKDSELYLIQFPLIENSSLYTKEVGFNKDIVIHIIELLDRGIGIIPDHTDADKHIKPLDFLVSPFLARQSSGMSYPLCGHNNLYRFSNSEYKLDIHLLSKNDLTILNHIISHVSEYNYPSFLLTRTYQNYVYDIIKIIYPSDSLPSAPLYAKIRNSLYKISSLKVRCIKDEQITSLINFFDQYNLYEDKNTKQLIVSMAAGAYFYERIIAYKIQSVFYNDLERIKDPTAQIVFHVLEIERQKSYVKNLIDCATEYHYTFFADTISFLSLKQVKRILDLIESIFRLFIELDILISSFYRHHNSFIIYFKTYSNADLEKLHLTTIE